MNDRNQNMRRILAVVGLAFVGLSLLSVFIAPGTFWNWGLLLVALACVFLSRRAA
ncbi:MAG TPA: hypothetical protein VFU22_15305 [Roseiflexaceae bacterium]|nr:hypothetical protein [Roseiflexaceae bacterium]